MSGRLFGIDDALDTDAWYTPPWIFDGLGVTFDLDVASPDDGLPWLPARQRYTVADDSRACRDAHSLAVIEWADRRERAS